MISRRGFFGILAGAPLALAMVKTIPAQGITSASGNYVPIISPSAINDPARAMMAATRSYQCTFNIPDLRGRCRL